MAQVIPEIDQDGATTLQFTNKININNNNSGNNDNNNLELFLQNSHLLKTILYYMNASHISPGVGIYIDL